MLVALQNVQADEAPPFVREGDRVEQVFESTAKPSLLLQHTETAAERDDNRPIAPPPPPLMNELREAPPRPVTYGYQLLPALVDEVSDRAAPEADQRNYSWPITESYIEGEKVKLEWAITDFRKAGSMSEDQRREQLRKIIRDYRELVSNRKQSINTFSTTDSGKSRSPSIGRALMNDRGLHAASGKESRPQQDHQ